MELTDPISGRTILFKKAQLPQRCRICGKDVKGEDIVHVEFSSSGWVCVKHLYSEVFKARSRRIAPKTKTY